MATKVHFTVAIWLPDGREDLIDVAKENVVDIVRTMVADDDIDAHITEGQAPSGYEWDNTAFDLALPESDPLWTAEPEESYADDAIACPGCGHVASFTEAQWEHIAMGRECIDGSCPACGIRLEVVLDRVYRTTAVAIENDDE